MSPTPLNSSQRGRKKTCISCRKTKVLTEFYKKTQRGKTYWASRCKKCHNEQNKKRKRVKWWKPLAHTAAAYDRKKFGSDYITLTPLDIKRKWKEQRGVCYWTSIPMEASEQANSLTQPSLERIDNLRPHTDDNCVLACLAVNRSRGNASIHEWTDFLKKLACFGTL